MFAQRGGVEEEGVEEERFRPAGLSADCPNRRCLPAFSSHARYTFLTPKLKSGTGRRDKHVWDEFPGAERVQDKVSGAPLFKNIRLPLEAITGNVDAQCGRFYG